VTIPVYNQANPDTSVGSIPHICPQLIFVGPNGTSMHLTDTEIKKTKPREKSYRLFDEGGLYIEITTK